MKKVSEMTRQEFRKARERGWNPPSPENIPLIQHGEKPTAVSVDIVTGYFWSEKEFDDINEIGQTLDLPGDSNLYGGSGSQPTGEYGVGHIYTHRDPVEASMLMDYMERGQLYEVTGHGFDRINEGIVSGGSLDQVERIFSLEHISSWREITQEELDSLPTLYDRLVELGL